MEERKNIEMTGSIHALTYLIWSLRDFNHIQQCRWRKTNNSRLQWRQLRQQMASTRTKTMYIWTWMFASQSVSGRNIAWSPVLRLVYRLVLVTCLATLQCHGEVGGLIIEWSESIDIQWCRRGRRSRTEHRFLLVVNSSSGSARISSRMLGLSHWLFVHVELL